MSCIEQWPSGGGPGGLSLAVVLGKYCDDVHVDLFESGPQFAEIGAGISVWKRTWFINQKLGPFVLEESPSCESLHISDGSCLLTHSQVIHGTVRSYQIQGLN